MLEEELKCPHEAFLEVSSPSPSGQHIMGSVTKARPSTDATADKRPVSARRTSIGIRRV
jgi:hypothetical protein